MWLGRLSNQSICVLGNVVSNCPGGGSVRVARETVYLFNYLFLVQPNFDDNGMNYILSYILCFGSMVITISAGETISQRNGRHFFHFYQTGL